MHKILRYCRMFTSINDWFRFCCQCCSLFDLGNEITSRPTREVQHAKLEITSPSAFPDRVSSGWHTVVLVLHIAHLYVCSCTRWHNRHDEHPSFRKSTSCSESFLSSSCEISFWVLLQLPDTLLAHEEATWRLIQQIISWLVLQAPPMNQRKSKWDCRRREASSGARKFRNNAPDDCWRASVGLDKNLMICDRAYCLIGRVVMLLVALLTTRLTIIVWAITKQRKIVQHEIFCCKMTCIEHDVKHSGVSMRVATKVGHETQTIRTERKTSQRRRLHAVELSHS